MYDWEYVSMFTSTPHSWLTDYFAGDTYWLWRKKMSKLFFEILLQKHNLVNNYKAEQKLT